MNYIGYGKTQTVTEFLQQDTTRSKAEAISWRDAMAGKSKEERQWCKVTRLVDLAIAYESDGDVGGQIDVAELTAASPHWFQRKPECRD